MPSKGLPDFPCPNGSAVTCQVGFWGAGENPEKSAGCTEQLGSQTSVDGRQHQISPKQS